MRPPVKLALKSAAWLSCLASLACSGPRPAVAANAAAAVAAAVVVKGPVEIPAHAASADILKSLSEVKGDVYASKCWTDKEGESCVLIWGKGNQPESDRSEMYAAKFHKVGAAYRKSWQIKEFTEGEMKWITPDTASLKILDLDGDKIAETRFFYAIMQDGLDPYVQKYMLHVANKKYAIRGTIPKFESYRDKYEKTPASNLAGLPSSIRAFADSDWDAYTKPILADLPTDGEPVDP